METSLTDKLGKIDEDIRGNGKLGMNVRLDRLENSKKLVVNIWFWIIISAMVPTFIGIYLSWGEFRSIEETTEFLGWAR